MPKFQVFDKRVLVLYLSNQYVKLNQAFQALAERFQEAAVALSQSDICRTLSQQLSDMFDDCYCYVLDVYGDDATGSVVYYQGGETRQAPYMMAMSGGKRTCTINADKSFEVLPRTVYDKVATSEADKNKAKGVSLIESATFIDTVRLQEAVADYAIKLMRPGRGSSAYYPAEVLERDGPKVFVSGTHMYWNHATAQQEAQRPEGDMNELAAVLTSNAYYEANGKDGPGLYARAKVFSDYAEKVAEKAKYTGLSIRARGTMSEAVAPDGKGNVLARFTAAESVDFVTRAGADGKVILTESAGADPNNPQQREASDMDAAEITKLVKEGLAAALAPVLAENKKLSERLTIAAEAPAVINEYFASVRVSEAIRQRVSRRAMEGADRFIVEGKLDAVKFKEYVKAETQDEADFISRATNGRVVVGMGTQAAALDPKALAEAHAAEETAHEKVMEDLGGLMLVPTGDKERDKRMREAFANGRAA